MSAVVLEATLYSFTEAEVDAEVNARKEIWARDLKNAREDILSRLQAVFPDATAFATIMTERQLKGYEAYINLSHPKAKKALTKLKIKWNDPMTYQRFSAGIQSAFSPGGRFEVGVDNAKDYWYRRVKTVAMVVGIRPIGLSLAPKLYMLLRGMDTSPYELPVDNVVTRPKETLVDPSLPDYVTMSVIPVIVDGAYWYQAFKNAGLEEDANSYITDYKNKLSTLISKLLKSGYTLDAFDFSYDEGVDRFRIYIKVVQQTA